MRNSSKAGVYTLSVLIRKPNARKNNSQDRLVILFMLPSSGEFIVHQINCFSCLHFKKKYLSFRVRPKLLFSVSPKPKLVPKVTG